MAKQGPEGGVRTERWVSVFVVKPEEVEQLYTWLEGKWSADNPCTFRLGHAGRVIIEGKERNELFKVCEWVRNCSPLEKKLDYSVIAYCDQKILYLSYCPKCRQKVETPHYLHSRGEKPA